MARAEIDGDRLWRGLMELAEIRDRQAPLYTRRPFTAAYAQARAWLCERMAAAGLAVHQDAAGNLIGRLDGRADGWPPLVLGSHVDTVAAGGRFDGALGVLAAIEVARVLAGTDERLCHPLEVVDFVAEEPTDQGVSCVGSRAWAGTLDEALLASVSPAGETLVAALPRAGADPSRLDEARRQPGTIAAYLELHIEQGRVLAERGLDVAVVEGIVGIRRIAYGFTGVASHSGTTPMAERHDALAGAAAVVLAAEQAARATGGALVATAGRITAEPNAANVVPGRVEVLVEYRALDAPAIERATRAVGEAAAAAAAARGLALERRQLTHVAPVAADADVRRALVRACAAAGMCVIELPSFAGHDGAQLAALAPVGMLFAPCRDGLSHHPDEWLEPAQAAIAGGALLACTRALDGDPTVAPHPEASP